MLHNTDHCEHIPGTFEKMRHVPVIPLFFQHYVQCCMCQFDWRRHWPTRKADPVEAPVGPINETATESQESAPAEQQEPASSSSGPAAPMPTQNFQSEQMGSAIQMRPQERRERKGARPERDANK